MGSRIPRSTIWKAGAGIVTLVVCSTALWNIVSRDSQCTACDCLYERRDRLSALMEELEHLEAVQERLRVRALRALHQHVNGDLTKDRMVEAVRPVIEEMVNVVELSRDAFNDHRSIIVDDANSANVAAASAELQAAMTADNVDFEEVYTAAQAVMGEIRDNARAAFVGTGARILETCRVRPR